MRQMLFKMERTGLLEVGDTLPVTEGKVGMAYYYILGRSYAMSANYNSLQRLKSTEGKVTNIEETPKGFFVTVDFDEDEIK